jgi:hypothetical protein
MVTVGRADVDDTVPNIVSREIIKYTMPNLEMWKRINMRWGQNIEVGDRVSIPTFTTRPAATQILTGIDGQAGEPATQTATYNDQTTGVATVFVQQFFHVAIELSAYAEAVSAHNLESLFKTAGLDSLAVQIDTTVMTLITGFDVPAPRGTLGTAMTDDIILDGFSDLDGGDVPQKPRSYIFSHLELANYRKIEKYVSNLYRNATPVSSGDIGDLYGANWAWSTNVPTPGAGQHNNFLFHPDAIGGIMRRQPKTAIAEMPDPGIIKRIVSWAVWGVNETRESFGVEMRGV